MQVLLINVKSKSSSIRKPNVPIALLKLSTYYKKKGYRVEYLKAGGIPKNQPDIICFSTVFLFNIDREIGFIRAYQLKFPKAEIRVGGLSASLRPDIFHKKLPGAEIFEGLCEEIETLPPDYKIVNSPWSYGFTHRGCPNGCKWCVVPKLEGKPSLIKNWKNALGCHDLFVSMDNNIMACGPERMEEILDEMHRRNMQIDFNQAMDCVLFVKNPDFAKVMSKHKKVFKEVRFAWDSPRQDKYIQKTLDLCEKYNIKGTQAKITWYVLYGFKDTPEQFFKKAKMILDNETGFKPMRYRDINTGSYLNAWNGFDDIISHAIGHMVPSGIYRGKTQSQWFGNNFEEFKKLIPAISKAGRKYGTLKRRQLEIIKDIALKT